MPRSVPSWDDATIWPGILQRSCFFRCLGAVDRSREILLALQRPWYLLPQAPIEARPSSCWRKCLLCAVSERMSPQADILSSAPREVCQQARPNALNPVANFHAWRCEGTASKRFLPSCSFPRPVARGKLDARACAIYFAKDGHFRVCLPLRRRQSEWISED